MNLTINGKDYALPFLTAADYDDVEEHMRKMSEESAHYIDRTKAAINVIVTKMQSEYPALSDPKQIKAAIPIPKLWDMFAYVTRGKNDAAQQPTGA